MGREKVEGKGGRGREKGKGEGRGGERGEGAAPQTKILSTPVLLLQIKSRSKTEMHLSPLNKTTFGLLLSDQFDA